MNSILPLVLQVFAFAVLLAEVLIPSFGVLTLVAAGLGIWSWYLIVTGLPAAGITAFAIADAILIPLAVRYGFRMLGRSPVSHRTHVGTGSGLDDVSHALSALVGGEALTDTALRPAGKIRVGEDLYEARTAGEFVDKGAPVRIAALRGAEFLVEKI
jgi:membrane-bound ClpP family serine protease